MCRPYVTRRRARRVGRGGFQEGDVSGWVRVRRDAVVVAIQRTHEVGIYKGLDVLGAHPDLAGPERKIPDRGVDASCASSTNRLDKCMR